MGLYWKNIRNQESGNVYLSQKYIVNIMHNNCRIHHVTIPIATRILIANVRQIGLSNVCVINLVYFKMQV